MPRARCFLLRLVGICFFVVSCLISVSCASRHTVTVRSDPPGATVTDIHRRTLGRTPFEVQVRSGSTLDLTFARAGFPPVKRRVIDIRYDQTVMEVLQAPVTALRVLTNPSGAELEILDGAGRRINFTNASDPNAQKHYTGQIFILPPGVSEVTLKMRKENYMPLVRKQTILPDQANLLAFELEPQFTRITIISDPEGVRVRESQLNFMDFTPVRDYVIPLESMRRIMPDPRRPGKQVNLSFTFSKEGYKTRNLIIPVTLNADNPPIEVKLEPLGREEEN